jgi:hypothetical protein
MPKGRPRKISAGSCTKPAPPPEKAEKRLAKKEIIKSVNCSTVDYLLVTNKHYNPDDTSKHF